MDEFDEFVSTSTAPSSQIVDSKFDADNALVLFQISPNLFRNFCFGKDDFLAREASMKAQLGEDESIIGGFESAPVPTFQPIQNDHSFPAAQNLGFSSQNGDSFSGFEASSPQPQQSSVFVFKITISIDSFDNLLVQPSVVSESSGSAASNHFSTSLSGNNDESEGEAIRYLFLISSLYVINYKVFGEKNRLLKLRKRIVLLRQRSRRL